MQYSQYLIQVETEAWVVMVMARCRRSYTEEF